MNLSNKYWQKQFLFCLGLFVAAAFCMKWMESDLQLNGETFSIMGLELFYSKEKVMMIMAGLDDHVKTILSYHLHFDFIFMAGVFPGVAALCMMAMRRNKGLLRRLLLVLTFLQGAAWAGDIYENLSLLKWMDDPVIGNDFAFYHFAVAAKWIIVSAGALVAGAVLLFARKKN